jgi:hypothetical protein
VAVAGLRKRRLKRLTLKSLKEGLGVLAKIQLKPLASR